jgi:hypothetical protein
MKQVCCCRESGERELGGPCSRKGRREARKPLCDVAVGGFGLLLGEKETPTLVPAPHWWACVWPQRAFPHHLSHRLLLCAVGPLFSRPHRRWLWMAQCSRVCNWLLCGLPSPLAALSAPLHGPPPRPPPSPNAPCRALNLRLHREVDGAAGVPCVSRRQVCEAAPQAVSEQFPLLLAFLRLLARSRVVPATGRCLQPLPNPGARGVLIESGWRGACAPVFAQCARGASRRAHLPGFWPPCNRLCG